MGEREGKADERGDDDDVCLGLSATTQNTPWRGRETRAKEKGYISSLAFRMHADGLLMNDESACRNLKALISIGRRDNDGFGV